MLEYLQRCVPRLACALLLMMAAMTAGAETLVIAGGTVIDPAKPHKARVATITVRDGRIHRVRRGTPRRLPDDATVIDASGAFVMPGLADMHNHLRSGTFRPGNDQAGVLRTMLGYGITTTFNPAVPAEDYERLRGQLAADPAAYPRAYLVKEVFTTEGGWGHGFKPNTPDEARAIVAELAAAGSDGVKLMYDDMRWATTRPFRIMSREIMTAIIDEAHARGLKAYAHAPVKALAREVIDAGVDCLIHGVLTDPLDEEFLSALRRRDVCYISTLTMFSTNAGLKPWADRLEAFDPFGRLDPKTLRLFRIAPTGTQRLDRVEWAAGKLPVLRDNLARVAAAGVPVIIGTDTGIPGVLPGIATQLEMQLHVEAGLTIEQVLRAATVEAARMVDAEREFGRLRRGMAADILVLDRDPRADIANVRFLRTVIRGGRVHEPAP